MTYKTPTPSAPRKGPKKVNSKKSGVKKKKRTSNPTTRRRDR